MEKETKYIIAIVILSVLFSVCLSVAINNKIEKNNCSKTLNNLCNTTNELIKLNNMQTTFINDKLNMSISFINPLTCEVFK
jgi:YbbR domain-containing protein